MFLCTQLSAQTLTNGNATWIYAGDITGAACNGNIDFDAGNGIDQAFSADWYYAIGANGLSVNFPAPSAANITTTDSTLVAFYPDLGGVTGLNATLTIILTEIGPLNVQAAQLMQIDNNTGGDIDIKLFNYLDLDKNNATTENAVLELQDECNLITAVTNVNDASQVCYFAVNAADGYEIDSYPNLCEKLDAGATSLSNSGLPLLGSDYTQAYQFDGTVPTGGSLTGETLVAFGEIPEAAVVDEATGQCTFPSTPAPEFTVGQPVQNCDGETFTLIFAFDGEASGTQYTFTEMTQAGVNPVTITDDGTVTEVTMGVYPYDASWNISVVGDFPGGAMPVFTGDSECPPPFDCQDLMADFGDTCDDNDATTVNDVITQACVCAGMTVSGCTDATACNYDAAATVDNSSCLYLDCEGVCGGASLVGTTCDDGDATTVGDVYDAACSCAGMTVPGCIEVAACNYDVTATVDDGSCLYLDCVGVCGGTTLAGSTCDDGDATTIGDMYDATCTCAGMTVPGCTDATACNYDAMATANDGSCLYLDCVGVCGGTTLEGSTCDDGDATTVGDVYDATCTCAGMTVPGCMEVAACNYDAAATVDDGNCLYLDCVGVCGGTTLAGSTCDDGNANTEDDVYTVACVCEGTPICMGQLGTLELGREGALSAVGTEVPQDGTEIYTWYNAADQVVAVLIGNPYYSPSVLGSYYVVVSHPTYDCFQILGPRTITELNGCCELDD